jgi:hypothetical protein
MPDDTYWKAPPRKRVLLTTRQPEEVRAGLETVCELWRLRAELNGDEADAIDLTYVVERLLRVGIDGAWGQALHAAGLERVPSTPEEWQQLRKGLTAPVKVKAKR